MKLLGWMHRKFWQNSIDQNKDYGNGHSCNLISGQPSLDEQQYNPKSNNGIKPMRPVPREHPQRISFAGLEEGYFDEDSSAAISDLFHGFLAIGTLGSDPGNAEPSTPTFAIPVENISETEMTDIDLKIVNEELEKVLGAVAKEEGCNDLSRRSSHVSTGRSSHVSTGRSSHGSTITLSGKTLEGTETTTNETIVCPLQGYLFGSATEFPGTTTVAKKAHRTSLGELFQMTKTAGENSTIKFEKGEKITDKESDKCTVPLIKKILKRRMIHPSSRSSTATVDSTSAETKLHKILQMFHKKVHPESTRAKRKAGKKQKNDVKNISHDSEYKNGDCMDPNEDSTTFSQKKLSKERIRHHDCQSNPQVFTLDGSESNGNREYWIKTDADYLVLEL